MRRQDPGKESWLADTLLWLLCDCVIRVEEEGRGGNRVSAMQCACVCAGVRKERSTRCMILYVHTRWPG